MIASAVHSALRSPLAPMGRRARGSGAFVPARVLVSAADNTYVAGFTRSGAVQVPDDTGVLRTFATDVPAREFRAGFGWGFSTHPTFTVGQNGKSSHSIVDWAFSSCTTAADATSPATTGGSTVVRERAVAGPWEAQAQWLGSVAAGTYLTATAIVGPQTNRVLGLHSNSAGVNFDYATGQATVAYGTAQTQVTQLAGGWYRVDARLYFVSTANNPIIYVKLIGAATVGDVTKGVHLYCVNLNGSGLMGMPIVSTSTTAAVIGEARWRNTLAALSLGSVGSMGIVGHALVTAPASSRHILRVDDGTDVARMLVYLPTGSGTPSVLHSVAGATVHVDTPASAVTLPGPFGIAANLTAALGSRSACNGVAMTASIDGAGAASGLTHWGVGVGAGVGFSMPMLVRKAWLHDAQLSAAQLLTESLTS